MSYFELIECCNRLSQNNISASCWTDDMTEETGHWSGTLAVMKYELGRSLTDAEVTCLSLGRAFGPCPNLEDNKLMDAIWPNGNGCGSWYEWHDLAEMISKVS